MRDAETMRATLGPEPRIDATAEVRASRLGRFTELGEGVRLLEVDLGDYSYAARFADLAYATVGKFANIAAFTRIGPGAHPMDRASLHHFQYRAGLYWADEPDEAAFFDWRRSQTCRLGHDCWLGHGAIVLAGRSVGTGAVVGAGAVVTRDVPPYTIVAGNPARPIRDRFPPAIAERLIRLGWWDWDHARLRAALPDFRALSVAAFLAKHEPARSGAAP